MHETVGVQRPAGWRRRNHPVVTAYGEVGKPALLGYDGSQMSSIQDTKLPREHHEGDVRRLVLRDNLRSQAW